MGSKTQRRETLSVHDMGNSHSHSSDGPAPREQRGLPKGIVNYGNSCFIISTMQVRGVREVGHLRVRCGEAGSAVVRLQHSSGCARDGGPCTASPRGRSLSPPPAMLDIVHAGERGALSRWVPCGLANVEHVRDAPPPPPPRFRLGTRPRPALASKQARWGVSVQGQPALPAHFRKPRFICVYCCDAGWWGWVGCWLITSVSLSAPVVGRTRGPHYRRRRASHCFPPRSHLQK